MNINPNPNNNQINLNPNNKPPEINKDLLPKKNPSFNFPRPNNLNLNNPISKRKIKKKHNKKINELKQQTEKSLTPKLERFVNQCEFFDNKLKSAIADAKEPQKTNLQKIQNQYTGLIEILIFSKNLLNEANNQLDQIKPKQGQDLLAKTNEFYKAFNDFCESLESPNANATRNLSKLLDKIQPLTTPEDFNNLKGILNVAKQNLLNQNNNNNEAELNKIIKKSLTNHLQDILEPIHNAVRQFKNIIPNSKNPAILVRSAIALIIIITINLPAAAVISLSNLLSKGTNTLLKGVDYLFDKMNEGISKIMELAKRAVKELNPIVLFILAILFIFTLAPLILLGKGADYFFNFQASTDKDAPIANDLAKMLDFFKENLEEANNQLQELNNNEIIIEN